MEFELLPKKQSILLRWIKKLITMICIQGCVKVGMPWYIALFVVSGSIKNLFLNDCVIIYLLSTFFLSIDFGGKCETTPHCLYCDSLTFYLLIHNWLIAKEEFPNSWLDKILIKSKSETFNV